MLCVLASFEHMGEFTQPSNHHLAVDCTSLTNRQSTHGLRFQKATHSLTSMGGVVGCCKSLFRRAGGGRIRFHSGLSICTCRHECKTEKTDEKEDEQEDVERERGLRSYLIIMHLQKHLLCL